MATKPILVIDPRHPLSAELLAALVQLVVDQQREIADWVVRNSEGDNPAALQALLSGTGKGIEYQP